MILCQQLCIIGLETQLRGRMPGYYLRDHTFSPREEAEKGRCRGREKEKIDFLITNIVI